MKYLNLGCGYNYSAELEWTNLDFASTGLAVIAHNLLNGIPFENNRFDLVYHSHVLEHFSKEDGEKLISECFRVLKPGGTIRIAIPNLEGIVRNYLYFLEKGLETPDNEMVKANYNWMMLEMYDQTVRNQGGGNMVKTLLSETLKNEDFIFQRIGEEGRSLRRLLVKAPVNSVSTNNDKKEKPPMLINIIAKIKRGIKEYLIKKLKIDTEAMEIGKFRMGGEIHQWMYDRYSLPALLKSKGGKDIQQRDAFTSYINNWAFYNIDGKDNVVRKPDSLYIEAIK